MQDPQFPYLPNPGTVAFDEGRNFGSLIGNAVENVGILLECLAFDVQLAVIRERGQPNPGLNVFSHAHRQFGNLKKLFMLIRRRMLAQFRRRDRQLLLEKSLVGDLPDLLVGQAVKQQGLLLGSNRGFDLVLLVLLLEQTCAGHDPAGSHLFKSRHFFFDDVQFFQRAKKRTLLLDEVLVSHPKVKQRRPRSDGLTPKRMNTRDDAGHRSGNHDPALPRPFDQRCRYRDGSFEVLKRDRLERQTDVLSALYTQLQCRNVGIPHVGPAVLSVNGVRIHAFAGNLLRRCPRIRNGQRRLHAWKPEPMGGPCGNRKNDHNPAKGQPRPSLRPARRSVGAALPFLMTSAPRALPGIHGIHLSILHQI